MKKKHRDITVNNIKYAWRVKINENHRVIIYKDKKNIYEEDITELPITPKVIEKIIIKENL